MRSHQPFYQDIMGYNGLYTHIFDGGYDGGQKKRLYKLGACSTHGGCNITPLTVLLCECVAPKLGENRGKTHRVAIMNPKSTS